MSSTDSLDDLPLDVLLALQQAMTDATAEGVERARLRAADAGFWLQCDNPPAKDAVCGAAEEPPVPSPEAPAHHGGIELDLDPGAGTS